MITQIDIENYKSIDKLSMLLGRVNVFIGENGAGKSNILEIIALGAAASADKLDNEFLVSRGIRVAKPDLMKSVLPGADPDQPISVQFKGQDTELASFSLQNDNAVYSKWTVERHLHPDIPDEILDKELKAFVKENIEGGIESDDRADLYYRFAKFLEETSAIVDAAKPTPEGLKLLTSATKKIGPMFQMMKKLVNLSVKPPHLDNFVIYSPENSSLRNLKPEGQIEPLGINGEGLLKLISFYADSPESTVLDDVKRGLKMLGWFRDFDISNDSNERHLDIKDKFIGADRKGIDHISANEGFFFLLFYFLLFNSELTPRFFAIDNIDASLNPKLCRRLMTELVGMAKKHDKQVILTTHNPAILDGLDLNDEEQRLFVVSRNQNGATRLKRIAKPLPAENQPSYKLSELFMDGALGGLPKGF